MRRSAARLATVMLAAVLNAGVLASELVIGQAAPLSGVLGTTGKQMVIGAQIYFDHINRLGGIHGARIKHVVLDDGYRVDETVRLTRQLVEKDQAVALFGYAGTANIGELLKLGVLSRANIALVAPYTGGEPLRKPFNPNVFHIRAGYADEGEHMVDHLVTLGIRRIAVFYQNDAFGKAGLLGVEQALARRGLELTDSASYERNTDDVSAAVKQLTASQPDAIIMVSVNRSTAGFVRAYRQAGGAGQLFNISVVDPAELVRLGGRANLHGLGIAQVVPYPYSPTLPVIKEYRELFKKYAPADAAISYTSFEEFIGAKVLVEGLRRAGPAPTPQKVLRALESLGTHDVGGFLVNFSPDNRIGSKFVEVTVIGRDGTLLR